MASRRARVGVDATPLAVHGKGVARYVRELLPALAGSAEVEVVALAAAGATLPAGAEGMELRAVAARPAIRWEQLGLPAAARSARLSLVHTTSDRLPLAPGVPIVLYLFEDPAHRLRLARPALGAKGAVVDLLTRTLFPRSLRRAALVLVSSQATRRDVEARGVPAARTRVVHPGVSERFSPAGDVEALRARLGRPRGYVLHLSSDDPRDQTQVALEAYAEAVRREHALPPLLVGGPVVAELPAQRAVASRLGLDGRVEWTGFLGGDALVDTYRAAAAYLDTSLFEGFGFQVAEALACGVPVVCSDTSSLPEVVDDAGLLVPSGDVRGFADALAAVVGDPARAAELRARGVERARRFTWARTARETVAAWLDVLGGRT